MSNDITALIAKLGEYIPNGDGHDSEFAHTLQSAIEALSSRPEGEAVAIPKGWAIARDGDWVSVAAPDGNGVRARHPTGTEQSVNDSVTLLVRLADALLSASPAAAEVVPDAAKCELRRLASAIASGYKRPWATQSTADVQHVGVTHEDGEDFNEFMTIHISDYTNDPADDAALAAYIAAANPNVILGLLDEIARLRTQPAHSEPSLAMVGAQAGAVPELSVFYGPMPESNGKSNFTAILYRGDDISGGFTFARSEYPDRVRYEADCMRHIIGQLAEEPDILTYDAEKHSGYAAPPADANKRGVPGTASCACGDKYPADSFGAGYLAAAGQCPNCDTAAPSAPVAADERVQEQLIECLQDWVTMHGDKDKTMRVLDAALAARKAAGNGGEA